MAAAAPAPWRSCADAGAIRAIGIGCNLQTQNAPSWLDGSHEDLYERLVDMVDLDFFIVAGGYTLLEQRALRRLMPLCERRGIGVVIASPYAGGWLAAPGEAAYMYAPASPDVVERSRVMQATCEAHGVPLATAALQFPLAHPAVVAVIPGAKSPAETAQSAERLSVPIPPALWRDLKAQSLIDPARPHPRLTATPRPSPSPSPSGPPSPSLQMERGLGRRPRRPHAGRRRRLTSCRSAGTPAIAAVCLVGAVGFEPTAS